MEINDFTHVLDLHVRNLSALRYWVISVTIFDFFFPIVQISYAQKLKMIFCTNFNEFANLPSWFLIIMLWINTEKHLTYLKLLK